MQVQPPRSRIAIHGWLALILTFSPRRRKVTRTRLVLGTNVRPGPPPIFERLPKIHRLLEERAAPQAVHPIYCSVLGVRTSHCSGYGALCAPTNLDCFWPASRLNSDMNSFVARHIKVFELIGVLMRIFSFSLVSWLG